MDESGPYPAHSTKCKIRHLNGFPRRRPAGLAIEIHFLSPTSDYQQAISPQSSDARQEVKE